MEDFSKTIRLIDAVQNVDTSEPQWVDLEPLTQALDLSIGYISGGYETRLKSYNLIKWLCTDTWVGTNVIKLDDEDVCITIQDCRKCDINVKFVSKEAADKLRAFLLTLLDEPSYSIINPDEKIPVYYKVNYNGDILHSHGFVNGEKVQIKRERYSYSDMKNVTIILADGTEKKVKVGEILFPMGLKPKDEKANENG